MVRTTMSLKTRPRRTPRISLRQEVAWRGALNGTPILKGPLLLLFLKIVTLNKFKAL